MIPLPLYSFLCEALFSTSRHGMCEQILTDDHVHSFERPQPEKKHDKMVKGRNLLKQSKAKSYIPQRKKNVKMLVKEAILLILFSVCAHIHMSWWEHNYAKKKIHMPLQSTTL